MPNNQRASLKKLSVFFFLAFSYFSILLLPALILFLTFQTFFLLLLFVCFALFLSILLFSLKSLSQSQEVGKK